MSKPYAIPLTEIRREYFAANSHFIATLAPTLSVESARMFIARLRDEYSDATHNVPAYIIGGGNTVTEFCSDDGEPAGTAGKPALAVLRGSGLGEMLFSDIPQLLQFKRVYKPQSQDRALYDEKFENFQLIYGQMKDIHHRMNG